MVTFQRNITSKPSIKMRVSNVIDKRDK